MKCLPSCTAQDNSVSLRSATGIFSPERKTLLEMAGPEPRSDDASTIIPGFSRDEQATLRALRLGHVTVDFALRRPWELDKPPLQEHRLEVYVESQ